MMVLKQTTGFITMTMLIAKVASFVPARLNTLSPCTRRVLLGVTSTLRDPAAGKRESLTVDS